MTGFTSSDLSASVRGLLGLLVGLGAVLATPAEGGAQVAGAGDPAAPVVELVGASDVALDRRITRLLDSDPVLVTGNRRIRAGDTIQGSVLLLDATLILEGVITGDLVIVDAGAFVRPGAVIRGDLVNAGGGLYRSELARVGGTIIDLPTASYRVIREEGRIVIEASNTPSRLTLDGFMGFQPPTYDRVNGVTAVWGARYRLPRLGPVTPSVHGQGGWRTELGEPTYAASLRLSWIATALEGGYASGWATNDDWIRGDLRNGLNYLWDGDDFRDYHQSERAWAEARREFGDVEKSFYGVLAVRGQVEDATSLGGDEPWHLWSGDPRPNPAIDEGRTTSVTVGFDVVWAGQETVFEGGVEYEAARSWLDGEHEFDRVALRGDWAMHALADHTLEIEFFVQQPLGSGALPLQEWSYVGGSGTLQTVPFRAFQGDRVVFVETKYIVPFPERVALPLLGAPDLELVHGAGMAWTEGEEAAFRQEVGARLQFFGLYFRFMAEPSDVANNDLDIGLSWPFGGSYPWERR